MSQEQRDRETGWTAPERLGEDQGGKGITRRRFVLSLGAGACAGIVGVLSYHALLRKPAEGEEADPDTAGKGQEAARPWLREDVATAWEGHWFVAERNAGLGPTTCKVNRAGAEVIQRLDGQSTLEAISEALAGKLGLTRTERTDAQVATFVAHLAMLGFLREPFHVMIHERVVG